MLSSPMLGCGEAFPAAVSLRPQLASAWRCGDRVSTLAAKGLGLIDGSGPGAVPQPGGPAGPRGSRPIWG